MRIAVIGTGVAGLTSAHILRRDHDLVVFEGDNRPGGHANTIRLTDRSGAFYLAFSEGGFRERRIRDLQMVFAKPGFAPPALYEPALASISA